MQCLNFVENVLSKHLRLFRAGNREDSRLFFTQLSAACSVARRFPSVYKVSKHHLLPEVPLQTFVYFVSSANNKLFIRSIRLTVVMCYPKESQIESLNRLPPQNRFHMPRLSQYTQGWCPFRCKKIWGFAPCFNITISPRLLIYIYVVYAYTDLPSRLFIKCPPLEYNYLIFNDR